jgi:hypothetical protein
MKSVYSAVRAGLLNEAVCASSLKVNDERKGNFKELSVQVFGAICWIKSFPDINPFLVLSSCNFGSS